MIDYLITSALFIAGVGFFIMGVVKRLKKQFNLGFKTVWSEFLKEEWDSLIVSGLVLFVWNIFLFICQSNNLHLPAWFDMWGQYVIATALGYSGQRLAFKYLTTIEEVLEKKADQLKQ